MGLGFKTFVAGVLSSSDVQGYLMQQAVITCTSGTRPGAPVTGMTIFETDTLAHRVWSGSGWDNLPGWQYGAVGTSANTALPTLATNVFADSTCKVTVVLNSQRRIKVYVQANFQCAASAPARYSLIPAYNAGATVTGAIGSAIAIPSASQICRVPVATAGSTGLATPCTEADVLLAAGTYTFYIIAARDLGGSATDAVSSPLIRVMDAGPS